MAGLKLVFSNDDIGVGDSRSVGWFKDVTAWLKSREIRATFFWIPMDGEAPSDRNKEWMEAIEAAMKDGQDVQWHGLTHDCLEFGVPQDGLRRENAAAFQRYQAEPLKWQYEHSRSRIKEKLEKGLEIFRRNFGMPVIFRSPCIGVTDGMYQGLAELGVRYSSSRIVNPQSWVYTATFDRSVRIWEPEFSPYPYKVFGVTEVPVMTDYCHWGLRDDRFDDIFDLACSDYRHLAEESRGLGVMLCHYHSMHKSVDGKGESAAREKARRFQDKLLDFLITEYSPEFLTFREACTSGRIQ